MRRCKICQRDAPSAVKLNNNKRAGAKQAETDGRAAFFEIVLSEAAISSASEGYPHIESGLGEKDCGELWHRRCKNATGSPRSDRMSKRRCMMLKGQELRCEVMVFLG